MCTVSWTRRPDGYALFFNRDELLARAEADPPRVHQDEGVRWLAPVDGDFGGTWIAVNERGLTLGLLNGFRTADATAPPDVRSRGLLVADLAPARDPDDVEARVATMDLDRYRSFRLLAIAPDRPARLLEWDRRTLGVDRDADPRRPVVSSSFDETGVGEARRRAWEHVTGLPAWRPQAPPRTAVDEPHGEPSLDALLAFHGSAPGGPSAYTVVMRRPEAATRSITRVEVGPDAVAMAYVPATSRPPVPPAGPGGEAPESGLRLPRKRVPSLPARNPRPETP